MGECGNGRRVGEGLEKEAMGSEAASPFTSVAQSLVLKNE
jgi:hypothetical protein